MNMKNGLIAALAVAIFASTFAGCNTVRGAGRDIEEGGEAIQDAATDAQN